MKIIGKATINPVLFYTGKTVGYITWILLLLSLFQIINIRSYNFIILDYLSYVLLIVSLIFSIISIINLGSSTTLGLPAQKLTFKREGLYKFSRNPMYVGFNLLTLSSIIYHMSIIIFILGIYSIYIYHLIILGEEKYMKKQYKDDYIEYQKQVRRYI